MEPKLQVSEGHYANQKYDTLERFISYHYQISSVLKKHPETVLEIGIGNRLVARYLSDQGVSVTTFDFDSRLNPDVAGDVRDIPLQDGSFDLILACQVLEHIPFDDFSKALAEIRRVTKKYAVISLPRRTSYFEFVFKFPLIRTLFKRRFFDIALNWYLRFGGFETSGQHYFEIDRGPYTLKKIREKLEEHFAILEEFSPVLNKYHYFFVLEKK